jgi:hypothetical protein
MQSLPGGTFAAAFAAELTHSYGRDYSELYRLVALANLPDKLKPILATALKLYEQMTLAQQVPGPFCSELVSRVYEHMGLALFKEARPSADISPNDLTNSKLVPVEEAVVSSDSVVDYKPSEQPTKDDLFTGLARSRRGTRLIEREVANLDKFGRSEKEKLQVDLASLQNAVQDSIKGAFQLFANVQVNGTEGLKGCPIAHWHRWLRAIAARAQEDRDAVRALEAHPAARSASTARPARRPGRVCSCRHRPELAAARIAGCPAAAISSPVHCVAWVLRRERQGRQINAGRPQPCA